MSKKTDELTNETNENVFTKEKAVGMARYKNRVDLLHVVLEQNKTYTLEQIDTLIDSFMKGGLK